MLLHWVNNLGTLYSILRTDELRVGEINYSWDVYKRNHKQKYQNYDKAVSLTRLYNQKYGIHSVVLSRKELEKKYSILPVNHPDWSHDVGLDYDNPTRKFAEEVITKNIEPLSQFLRGVIVNIETRNPYHFGLIEDFGDDVQRLCNEYNVPLYFYTVEPKKLTVYDLKKTNNIMKMAHLAKVDSM